MWFHFLEEIQPVEFNFAIFIAPRNGPCTRFVLFLPVHSDMLISIINSALDESTRPEILSPVLNFKNVREAIIKWNNALKLMKHDQQDIPSQNIYQKFKKLYKMKNATEESLQKSRKNIGLVRCHNYQRFGFTNTCCTLPSACITCGDLHTKGNKNKDVANTKNCRKYGGPHVIN